LGATTLYSVRPLIDFYKNPYLTGHRHPREGEDPAFDFPGNILKLERYPVDPRLREDDDSF